MKTIRVVKFHYKPSKEVLALLNTFGQMCNDAVRIAIDRDAHSRFDLIEMSYEHLKAYGPHPLHLECL